jgi:acetylornithine deacetylase/succinyl-diaminopimelate desuccinylase-like protein
VRAGHSEALTLAARYIKHLTVETPAVRRTESPEQTALYLKHQLETMGLATEVIRQEGGQPNLVARLEAAAGASSGGALLLTAALDPVPGRDSYGIAPAAVFSALLAAIAAYEAGTRAGAAPPPSGGRRQIVLALTTEGAMDEPESGLAWLASSGMAGADRLAGALTCGGLSFRLMDKGYLSYCYAGFGQATVRVAAVSGAHGDGASLPAWQGRPVGGEHPIVLLARSLAELGRWETPVHVTPAFQQYVEALAAPLSPPHSAHVRSLLNPLMTREAAAHIASDEDSRALIIGQSSNSYIPTGLAVSCGEDGRVHSAETRIDCTLLPGQSAVSARRELEELFRARGLPVDGNGACRLEVSAVGELPWTESPAQSDLTRALHRAMRRKRPGTTLVPAMGYCGPGIRTLRLAGVPVYGFFPGAAELDGPGLEPCVSILWEAVTSFACGREQ